MDPSLRVFKTRRRSLMLPSSLRRWNESILLSPLRFWIAGSALSILALLFLVEVLVRRAVSRQSWQVRLALVLITLALVAMGGAAAMLAALHALARDRVETPVDTHWLFTISEEVGVAALEIRAGDAVGEQRVAADQRPVGHDEAADAADELVHMHRAAGIDLHSEPVLAAFVQAWHGAWERDDTDEADDAQAAMARDDAFRHGGHADRGTPDFSEKADCRLCV